MKTFVTIMTLMIIMTMYMIIDYIFTALEYKHLAWAAVGRDEELVEDIQ